MNKPKRGLLPTHFVGVDDGATFGFVASIEGFEANTLPPSIAAAGAGFDTDAGAAPPAFAALAALCASCIMRRSALERGAFSSPLLPPPPEGAPGGPRCWAFSVVGFDPVAVGCAAGAEGASDDDAGAFPRGGCAMFDLGDTGAGASTVVNMLIWPAR